MAAKQMVEALESFSVTLANGAPFVVNRGDRFWSDDEVCKGRTHLFGEVSVRSSGGIRPAAPAAAVDETASAAPGARRGRTKPEPKDDAADDGKATAKGAAADA